jgi:probable selenium-dependent hydroxylase accessory protein YqeC
MALGLAESLLLSGGGVVSLVGAGGKTTLMYRLAHALAGSGQTVLTTTTTHIRPPTAEQCAVCILAPDADGILERAGAALRRHRHISAAAGSVAGSGKLSGLAPGDIGRLHAARVCDWIIVEADGAAGRPLKAPAAHEPVIPPCSGWTVGVVGLQALGQPLSDPWVFRMDAFAAITGLAAGAALTVEAVAAACGHEYGLFKGAPAGCRCLAFLNRADSADRKAAAARIAALIPRSGEARIRRVIVGQALAEPPVSAVFDFQTRMELCP